MSISSNKLNFVYTGLEETLADGNLLPDLNKDQFDEYKKNTLRLQNEHAEVQVCFYFMLHRTYF